MIITTDNFPIYAALICAGTSSIAYLVLAIAGDRLADSRLARFARWSYYSAAIAIGYASLYLLQQLLSNSRYDIGYINEFSAPTDGLIYRVSSFWAGQQGSMLLWGLLCSLAGVLMVRRLSRSAPVLLAFWSLVVTAICILLVAADPFKRMADYQLGSVGRGLNPLLKNPWMAIHPPVVFLGYALLIVPAAFAIHALIKGDTSRWAKQCLPWTLFGWASLSAGLILGMIWSYEVLGWGGYWGWDPVENASLVPWILSTALLHGLLLNRYRGRMARGNIILALATFLTIVYATFLTRSGVLAESSVHSFQDLGSYKMLLWFLIVSSALCVGLLLARWRAIKPSAAPLEPVSKDFALVAGVIGLVLMGLVVLVGTSYPLLTRIGVNAGFYTRMSVPIAILVAMLMSIAPSLEWSRAGNDARPAVRRFAWLSEAFIIMAILTAISAVLAFASPKFAGWLLGWLISPEHPMFRMAGPALFFLVVSSVLAFVISVLSGARSSIGRVGAYVAHAGVALLFLGVVLSATGRSQSITLSKNGPQRQVFGYEFFYRGHGKPVGDKEILDIRVRRGGRVFRAPMSIQQTQQGAVRSPFIRSTPLGDLYISPRDSRGTVVTATMSMTGEGFVSIPTRIPGSDATLALAGMQVERHMAVLEYQSAKHAPERFELAQGKPVMVDGYTFAFQRFMMSGGTTQTHATAGVDIGVSGGNMSDKITIEVSTKPLISLLWLGTVLIILGGLMAALRRRAENARSKDGILPDIN